MVHSRRHVVIVSVTTQNGATWHRGFSLEGGVGGRITCFISTGLFKLAYVSESENIVVVIIVF